MRGMGRRRISGLALTAMLAPSQGAAAPPAPAAPAVVYRCHARSSDAAGGSGVLTLDKELREDGSAARLTVKWEDQSGSFLRPYSRDDRLSAELNWPGDDPYSLDRSFDWARGSIRVYSHGAGDGLQFRPRKREMWRQVLIDRDESFRVNSWKGDRLLVPIDFVLANSLEPLSSPGDLWTRIDRLVAWGSGTGSVTVYGTLVTRRRVVRNRYPNSPDGERRIVVQYGLDTTALARLAARIKAATEAWEATLGDFKSRCERGVEESGDIILT